MKMLSEHKFYRNRKHIGIFEKPVCSLYILVHFRLGNRLCHPILYLWSGMSYKKCYTRRGRWGL